MAKLGKNAQAILARLQARPERWYTAQMGVERGPYGGKGRPYGRREMAAAIALVDAGLAEVVQGDHFESYNRGYASYGHELSIRLRKA